MANVWYIGMPEWREITSEMWAASAISGAASSLWNVDNGWSIPQDEFTDDQLAILDADPQFLLNQFGLRTTPPPYTVGRNYEKSAFVYYRAIMQLLGGITGGDFRGPRGKFVFDEDGTAGHWEYDDGYSDPDSQPLPDVFVPSWGSIVDKPPLQRIMRPNGPLTVFNADSIQSLGTKSTSSSMVSTGGPIIGRRCEWESHRQMQMTYPLQDPGDTMADVLGTQLPALLALDPIPNAAVLAIFHNDGGGSFNLNNYLAQYTYWAEQVFARGICPIFFTPTPTGTPGSPTPIADANARRLGEALLKLGPKLGIPVFDQYAAVADENGGIKAIYSNGVDGVHLNAKGYQKVARYLINQGFGRLFPAVTRSTIVDTADPQDLMAGAGLFKSGAPTGFSVVGAGTSVSYVDPDPADGLAGRWARVVKASGSTDPGAFRFTKAAVVTPGKRYRASGRLKMEGTWDTDLATPNYLQIAIEWRTGTTLTAASLLVNRWDVNDPITFSEDFTAPAGVDGLRMVAYMNGVSVDDQVAYHGAWSIRNLTDMGI